MFRFIAPFFLFAWCAHAAAVQEITLTNGEWRPFQSEQLPHYGVISRVVTEAFALEGIKVRYVFRPWPRALAEARAGLAQGSLVWSVGAPGSSRERDFLFSDTVLEDRSVFFHRRAVAFSYSTLNDLARFKMGGVKGYEYVFDNVPGLQMDRAPNEELSMRKLVAGRVDVVPGSYQVGMYMLRTMFMAGQARGIVVHPTGYNMTRYHLIFPRTRPDSPQLVQAFNRGLERLRKSGRYSQYMADLDAGRY